MVDVVGASVVPCQCFYLWFFLRWPRLSLVGGAGGDVFACTLVDAFGEYFSCGWFLWLMGVKGLVTRSVLFRPMGVNARALGGHVVVTPLAHLHTIRPNSIPVA